MDQVRELSAVEERMLHEELEAELRAESEDEGEDTYYDASQGPLPSGTGFGGAE